MLPPESVDGSSCYLDEPAGVSKFGSVKLSWVNAMGPKPADHALGEPLPDASGHPSAGVAGSVDSSQPSWGGKGADELVQGGEDKSQHSPLPLNRQEIPEELRENHSSSKELGQGFVAVHRGLLELQEMLRARTGDCQRTDLAGAETRLPRGGQKHARGAIGSPREGGPRKREDSGSGSRNAVVSVSWGPARSLPLHPCRVSPAA